MEIEKLRPHSVNISFDGDFKGGEALSQSSVMVTPAVPDKRKDIAYTYVEFSTETNSLHGDFKLVAEIVIPFGISHRMQITSEELYSCIVLANEHLQNVLNSIFYGHPTPVAPPILFDEISDKLDENIQTLRQ